MLKSLHIGRYVTKPGELRALAGFLEAIGFERFPGSDERAAIFSAPVGMLSVNALPTEYPPEMLERLKDVNRLLVLEVTNPDDVFAIAEKRKLKVLADSTVKKTGERSFSLETVILYVRDQDQFYSSISEVNATVQAGLRALTAGHNSASDGLEGFSSFPLMLGLKPIGALAWRPNNAAALNNLGVATAILGNAAGAASLEDMALALDPDRYSAAVNAGRYHLAAGALPAAQTALERARTLRPQAPAPMALLAVVLWRRGERERARELMAAATAIDASDAEVRAARQEIEGRL